eukprot:1288872-Heterocapsa_arctica.AAC.1
MHKISLGLSPHLDTVLVATLQLLALDSGEVKHGLPPRGPTARKVEAALRRAGAYSAQRS